MCSENLKRTQMSKFKSLDEFTNQWINLPLSIFEAKIIYKKYR